MPTLRALALVIWITASSCEESRESQVGGGAEIAPRRVLDALADGLELEHLRSRLAELWPIHPRHLPALHAWLVDADALARRLPDHRKIAARLRATALPYTDADRARDLANHPRRDELNVQRERLGLSQAKGDASGEQAARRAIATLEPICRERRTWRFANVRDDWLQRQLADLLRELAGFSGDIVKARSRITQIAKLEALAREDQPEWQAARAAGLAIAPQFGLVPIGRDPKSMLWEFAVRSSGEVPARDAHGRIVRTPSMAIVLVLLPGGQARVGAVKRGADAGSGPHVDPDAHLLESPVHSVRLDAFLIGKYEVTQAQWKALTGENPSEYGETVAYEQVRHTPLHPVERVSWVQCRDVLRRFGMRLPTEVQWEYAARAGTVTPWSSGLAKESLVGCANLADQTAARYNASWAGVHDWPELNDGFCLHSPCGRFTPNAWGLHDVHGNVWEWCRDNHGSYLLPARDGDGYREVHDAKLKAVRSGSYNMPASAARSANRGVDPADLRSNMVGVRAMAEIER